MKNRDELHPNNELRPSQLKWILMTVGLALTISVVFNLILVFNTDNARSTKTTDQQPVPSKEETLLKEAHTIDKKINKNGIIWLGIKTTPDEARAEENYEFWRISEKNEKLLIENFPLSVCDEIDWDLNEKNGINLLYFNSPCEAFSVKTNIIYNEQGIEQLRMEHNSSAGSFTFQQVGNSEYKVSLIVDGKCEGQIPQPPTEALIPKVLLKGVKLTTYGHENEFILTKPVKISCSMGYGEVNIDPIITNPVFGEEKIEFTLPNDQKATISLKATNYAEVEFKQN